jgi:hypothetical protein
MGQTEKSIKILTINGKDTWFAQDNLSIVEGGRDSAFISEGRHVELIQRVKPDETVSGAVNVGRVRKFGLFPILQFFCRKSKY